MTQNISDHGTAQRVDGRPVQRQLQGTRQSVFKRLMMCVTTCAIALAAFVVVDASSGRASDVEGIYGLSTTNASGNVDPIGAVNSFRVFMKPTTTSTQFQVSFDTGSVSYSLNGSSGSLTSGVPSDPLAVPIGESDLVLTYTNSLSEQSVYHVYLKRPIEITSMWFEGTTVSSPTNFDSSTTVTVPLTPVWNANADGLSPGFTVSVPHGVVKGRLVWTYSRVGQQSVTGYSVSYDANGINSTDYGYDSNTLTGKATSGWGGLGVGSNRYKVNSGTVISSGDVNLSYAVYITRRAATVVPGPPLVRAAEPADATSALVTWDPPTSDGGETIDSYTVTSYSVTDVALGTCETTTTSCLVTGLTTGATYTFAVVAKNVNGNGPVSVATSAVTILAVPNAPTAVTAVAGVNSASVSWSAPVVDGGSVITGYRVTSSPDGLTCQPQSVVTLSCDVTGLTSGTNYTFTVIAINAIGNSVASTVSNSVSPTAPATTTTVPAVTTTVPAVTTTVPAVTTTVPAVTTTVPTVPAPAESVVLNLPQSSQPLLADTALAVGEQVSLEGEGFVPGEDVHLIVASTPQIIATGQADSSGRVRLSGTLPSNLASGQHNLALYAPGSGRGVRQPITVEQISLPATGMGNDLTAQLLLAVLVTAFGLLQFVSKKRRVISR
jgi:hypothetical protein